MDCVEAAYSCSETNSEPLPGFSGAIKNRVGKNLRGRTAKKVKNVIRSAKLTLSNTLTIPYTESCCCVCSKTEKSRPIIPAKARLHFWNEAMIWIPSRNRCCESHLLNGRFNQDSCNVLKEKAKPGAKLSGNDVEEWFQRLTNQKPSQLIDVDSDELSDMDYDMLFGLKREHFDLLFGFIKADLKPSTNRTPRNALAIFLMKLRLGISQRLIGFLFNLPQKKVSSTIARVSDLLFRHFVPKHLGFFHKTREEFIESHDSEFVRKLYNAPEGSVIVILDGTYLYVQKSGDHKLQKGTFCLPKGRNLVKIMMVVTATGYIVEASGNFTVIFCN